MSSSSKSSDTLPNVDEYNGRMFVDVCTDGAMAAKVIGYRKTAGALIKVFAGSSVEATYAKGLSPSPTGDTLPLPVQKSWVVVSYMP